MFDHLLNQFDLGDINVKEFGNKGDYLIKFERKILDDVNIKIIKEKVANELQGNVDFRRVENVGPKVSKELLESGLFSDMLSIGSDVILYLVRFEWQFLSVGSIIAIFHDVLITIGLFSLLSLEINLSIVAAVLTIVGYSMNDTVVIYDRIRENLNKYSSLKIGEISNKSINETLSRTIITSSTTLLALISIFILWRSNFKRLFPCNDYWSCYWYLLINFCGKSYIKIPKCFV